MTFEKFISKMYDAMEKGRGEKFAGTLSDCALRLGPSIAYYNEFLFEKVIRIFEWSGLPFPQKVLEAPVMATGYAGFLYDEMYGNYVALPGGLTGVTPFGDLVQPSFVYAAPKCEGGTRYIYPFIKGGDCVLIENTSLRTPIIPLVNRYATLLAHADVSIRDALINIRYNEAIPAGDDSEADTIKEWHNKVIAGEYAPIPDTSLLNRAPIIPLNVNGKGQIALDTIEARGEILRNFFAEIGVRMVKDKRSNMIEDEVTSSDMALMFNLSDMLKHRQEAAENISRLFDLSVSVKLSDEFNDLSVDTTHDGDI